MIGEDAASLNTRSSVWSMLAVIPGLTQVALTVVAPLSGGVANVGLQLSAVAAFILALARSLWLAHLAAEAANRYLTARLGFPVHYRLGPITPAQWRKSIARKVEEHDRSAPS